MAKLPKVHVTKTGKYIRIRVRHPKKFKERSIRTHDIGRAGHSKRLAGRLKKNNRWATQAFLVLKTEPQHVPRFKSQAKAIISRAKKRKRK